MERSNLVSVIMPAYNSAEFIGDAIRSVQNQTYRNWELLIVDDASTDSTLQIIQEFSNSNPRIKILQNERNLGAGISRNKAIKAALGDFIAFLDSDDLWKPKKLEIQLMFMKEEGLAVSFSSYELMSQDGKRLQKYIKALPLLTYQKLLKSNYLGNLTGMYDVRKLGKVYGPEIKKRQDWGLWLEAVKNNPAKGIQKPLAIYRIRKNSISSNKLEMLHYNFKVYNEVLGFGFGKSILLMLNFLREHFFVKNQQIKRLDK